MSANSQKQSIHDVCLYFQIFTIVAKTLATYSSTIQPGDAVIIYVVNPLQQFLTYDGGMLDMSAWSAMFAAMESITNIRTQFVDINELHNMTPVSLRSLALRAYSVARIGDPRWDSCHESGEKIYGAPTRVTPSTHCNCEQDRGRHRHVALYLTYSVTYIQSVEALEDPSLDSSSPDLSNCPMIVNAVFTDDSGELLETMTLTSGDYHKREGSKKTVLEWILSELHQQALQYMSTTRHNNLWDFVVCRVEGEIRDEEVSIWKTYLDVWSSKQKGFDRENHRDREKDLKGSMTLTTVSYDCGMQILLDHNEAALENHENTFDNDPAIIYVTQQEETVQTNGYLITMDENKKSDYHVLEIKVVEARPVAYFKPNSKEEKDYYQKLLVRLLRQIYSLTWLQGSQEGPYKFSHLPVHLRMIRDTTAITKLLVAHKHAQWKGRDK
jgi:hypothetical protein